jgi:hypothetical protein
MIHCGDFCGECTNISRQADASRRIEPQRAKFCESRCVGSKSLKMKHVPRAFVQVLIIRRSQVQILAGPPNLEIGFWK